mmetsp:Transcript_2104/g.6254  ORF Transcript_2104/g.6254 Transcript_2104/m.6254 type:complete len:178 (+) Transcript_2104:775-1308(+)
MRADFGPHLLPQAAQLPAVVVLQLHRPLQPLQPLQQTLHGSHVCFARQGFAHLEEVRLNRLPTVNLGGSQPQCSWPLLHFPGPSGPAAGGVAAISPGHCSKRPHRSPCKKNSSQVVMGGGTGENTAARTRDSSCTIRSFSSPVPSIRFLSSARAPSTAASMARILEPTPSAVDELLA